MTIAEYKLLKVRHSALYEEYRFAHEHFLKVRQLSGEVLDLLIRENQVEALACFKTVCEDLEEAKRRTQLTGDQFDAVVQEVAEAIKQLR